jgi:hypothetical protein
LGDTAFDTRILAVVLVNISLCQKALAT